MTEDQIGGPLKQFDSLLHFTIKDKQPGKTDFDDNAEVDLCLCGDLKRLAVGLGMKAARHAELYGVLAIAISVAMSESN